MNNSNLCAIEVKNLNYSFDEVDILHDINIDFKKNKFYSIIGPNGSGKTTLLKNIAKTLKPYKSTVFIKDKDILDLKSKALARKLAVVPQNSNLDMDFSVQDIVLMGRAPYFSKLQSESESDYNIAKQAMEVTNTWRFRDKFINQLSGGEKQRVLIARALTQDTDIILLDEPISNLDIYHQIEILDNVKSLSKKITVIMVLHDLNFAAQYSDHVILVNSGRVVMQGTPREVLTEKNIKKVYKINVCIIKNPVTGKPYIIPIGQERDCPNMKNGNLDD
ncbi:heme ABC transporter ATP-binding protein [Clostridium coskatii]|uniref:Siderophore transport system ATP-binding protein YusV n=1 Tax=Clostridium coskatii TaxID=1705578 RepID=A0A162NFE1_9CLOT|nr:heme ABC transporter ATP-binding protein [Clostridium coskatii]OAA92789.1 putative siderophore transport system ATP-binding protein YusV [Clostridium coskatii]OBR92166.1 putative siderophore transport system ATP-binding protein YusV [Clostridium coskatii]